MDLINAASDGDINSLNSLILSHCLDAKVPVDIVTHVRCLITLSSYLTEVYLMCLNLYFQMALLFQFLADSLHVRWGFQSGFILLFCCISRNGFLHYEKVVELFVLLLWEGSFIFTCIAS